MKIQYKWWLIFVAFVFVACQSDDDASTAEEIVITSGTADFSVYVSLGNSLTAGFTDGALFIKGQENSMPNILAEQFSLASGGVFSQPLMNDNIGGALLGGNLALSPRLFFDGEGPAVLSEVPTTEITSLLSGSFNNMGIPGAKSFHLLVEGYGNVAGVATGQANPYFARMASSSSASVLGDAMTQNPTFFSLWIGNNDVLGYALSGGDGTDPITDIALFNQAYTGLVSTLISNGAKGVVANIPDVTSIPFFTTVPFAPLDPENPDFGPQIPVLNAQFEGLNQAFTFLGVPERSIVFSETEASPVIIKDESLMDMSAQLTQVLIQGGLDIASATIFGLQYGQARQANENDLLVLTSSSIIATLNQTAFDQLIALGVPETTAEQLSVNGVTFPLEDKWVLIPSEVSEITSATEQFNATIEIAYKEAGLAFVDANTILKEISDTGILFDDFLLQGNLVFGGAFSLDGVHPTARGYAFIANKAIEAINSTYGSNIPFVKAEDYPTFYSEIL